jgi:hypothetical protein
MMMLLLLMLMPSFQLANTIMIGFNRRQEHATRFNHVFEILDVIPSIGLRFPGPFTSGGSERGSRASGLRARAVRLVGRGRMNAAASRG